jgi:hypothetical protein
MAQALAPAPRIEVPESEPEEIAALLTRTPDVTEHGPYLEAFHELTYKVLERIDILMAKGDHESAKQLVTALRARQDAMWTERVKAAQRGVAG